MAATAAQVVARSGAACTILDFNDCDKAGHAHGWMSAPYLEAARRVDDGVATLAPVVETEEDVALLVVADHGGGGLVPHDHDGAHPLNEAIPLIAGGAGLPRGRTCAMPASLLDVAPTILHLLDVPVPASYEGRVLRSLVEGVVAAA